MVQQMRREVSVSNIFLQQNFRFFRKSTTFVTPIAKKNDKTIKTISNHLDNSNHHLLSFFLQATTDRVERNQEFRQVCPPLYVWRVLHRHVVRASALSFITSNRQSHVDEHTAHHNGWHHRISTINHYHLPGIRMDRYACQHHRCHNGYLIRLRCA